MGISKTTVSQSSNGIKMRDVDVWNVDDDFAMALPDFEPNIPEVLMAFPDGDTTIEGVIKNVFKDELAKGNMGLYKDFIKPKGKPLPRTKLLESFLDEVYEAPQRSMEEAFKWLG